MTPPSETATDHQMAAEDDEGMLGRIPDPAGPLPSENLQRTEYAAVWQPGTTAVGSPAEVSEVVGRDDAERSTTLRSTTFPVPDAEPESVPEAPAASATASLSTRWHEIQAMFVDDPRTCAELAAGLVDEGIQGLIAFVKEQQDSLLTAWHGEDAGTEELRIAVRHYRAFGDRLADFSRES
jgi:hypothetical protein